MKVFISGGAGFIGSHVAEYYAKKGYEVVVLDNLSRASLLHQDIKAISYNWDYLQNSYPEIKLVKGDVRNISDIDDCIGGADVAFHTAAQTAVTTSTEDPSTDFDCNALGTFNVVEACRKNGVKSLIYCSTNKVYGDNVNEVGIKELDSRYSFDDKYANGIPEGFSIDRCEHTPYGCSKLTGDLYVQDYAHLYGIKTGVFRMSCIYGTRQLGVEDQGWVAWFIIATLTGKPVTIFGDGKQVRDILFVQDLVAAYDAFLESDLEYGVYNMGGGPGNTISLLELVEIIKDRTGLTPEISFDDWRPCDQKVYISDIEKAQKELGWKPETSPRAGVERLIQWVEQNQDLFA